MNVGGEGSASIPKTTHHMNDSVISVIAPILEYTPPPFATEPCADDHYGLEVIKTGTLINRIDFERRKASTFVVIGRLASCDIELQHPTISRYHCILQYGEDLINGRSRGWHIYDLGSTHGTKLNKKRIPPKQFIRIHVGYVMQFGGSTRIMTLFGPDSDIEAEWEYSPTEMRRMVEQKKLYDKIQEEKEKRSRSENDSDGIMWGMDYDEEQAYAQAHGGDHIEDREEKYRDDPLKVLSRFFEQEGFDMEFTYEESGTGHNHKWSCSIELPVDTAAGQSLAASATCSGSKKEAQALCAFSACKTLDMHGILFRSSNEVRKKAKNLADNDYYDSDEDTYFDRTGQIEKNREKRRARALELKGKLDTRTETFETLTKKIASTSEELSEVEAQLTTISTEGEEKKDGGKEDDDLDKYCSQLGHSSGVKNSMAVKIEKSILRQRLVFLKREKERLEKLAKIAKPVELPALKITSSSQSGNTRAAGSLSSVTMKKLMKLRRAKVSTPKEKERDKPVGMELPPDTFIKETVDTLPFVAEVENDEEPSIGSITSSNVERIDAAAVTDAVTEEELNIPPSTSEIDSQNRFLNEKHEKSERVAAVSSDMLEELPCNEKGHVAAVDVQQMSIKKDDRASGRKRIRTRDGTTSNREKIGGYGEGVSNNQEDYVMWMPPKNQKGDGTNMLNEKFAGRY